MNFLPRVVALTGGIGSGKSVVRRMLQVMGWPVYDCDREARTLMDTSPEIKHRLQTEIDPDVVDSRGEINRPLLARIVFNDPAKLETLNAIVHPAVHRHMAERIRECRAQLFFFETAILESSGLEEMAGDVWFVDAPVEVRVERVMRRNNLTRRQVWERIKSQSHHPREGWRVIQNDGAIAVLPQVLELLGYEKAK